MSGPLPIILALGTTQTLAWASSMYLPAILADEIIIAGICRPCGEGVNRNLGIYDLHGTGSLARVPGLRLSLVTNARHNGACKQLRAFH